MFCMMLSYKGFSFPFFSGLLTRNFEQDVPGNESAGICPASNGVPAESLAKTWSLGKRGNNGKEWYNDTTIIQEEGGGAPPSYNPGGVGGGAAGFPGGPGAGRRDAAARARLAAEPAADAAGLRQCCAA